MSYNLTLFLPACLMNPPHMSSVGQCNGAAMDWTSLLNCDQLFIYSLYCYVWLKIHTLLPSLNIVAQRGFNGPCFLLFRETTALTKWSDHLKLRMTNVFPAQHRGIVDLCHGRMRVELFIYGFSASFVIHFLAVVYGVWSTFSSSSLFCELIGTLAWSLHVLWPISDSISFDSEPSESNTPGAETFFPTPEIIVRNLIRLVLVQVQFLCSSKKKFSTKKVT